MWVCQRNRRNAFCRRYCCLIHIYPSATVVSLLTTGAEGSEKGTGKTITGFVLKSPVERIPVSYCYSSMEALWARLHCSAFWSRLVNLTGCFPYDPYFGQSHRVCDNTNVGRVPQADQVTLGGICLKKRNKLLHWKCWAVFVYWL